MIREKVDVRVLTGLVCPAARPPARPLGVRQYPGTLKGCGVEINSEHNLCTKAFVYILQQNCSVYMNHYELAILVKLIQRDTAV